MRDYLSWAIGLENSIIFWSFSSVKMSLSRIFLKTEDSWKKIMYLESLWICILFRFLLHTSLKYFLYLFFLAEKRKIYNFLSSKLVIVILFNNPFSAQLESSAGFSEWENIRGRRLCKKFIKVQKGVKILRMYLS